MRYRILIVIALLILVGYCTATSYAMWADTWEPLDCYVTTNHVEFSNGVTVDSEAVCTWTP